MSVQSLDRAFDILELLSRQREGMPLIEIGKELDLNKSTAHRLISSLRNRGYIEQEESGGKYKLGLGFIALASQYLNRLEIKTEAEPYLKRLSDQLRETVFLASLNGNEVVYLDKVERFGGFRRYSIIGQRVPVHCTSLGKALILDKKETEIIQLLGNKLPPITNHTITDIHKLLTVLNEYRQQGWTRDIEEHNAGVSCAGAPIRDYRGEIIAAISSVWTRNKSGHEIDDLGLVLKETADEISRHLGYIE